MSAMATSGSTPSDISSIVPGTIFQDDIPPPTLVDGSGTASDPQQQYSPTPSPSGTGQIEVTSTIQIVLISLGIAVGALFLFAVAATYFISHKNKRDEERRQKALEQDEEKGKGSAPDMPNSSSALELEQGGFSSSETVNEKREWNHAHLSDTDKQTGYRAAPEADTVGANTRSGTPGPDSKIGSKTLPNPFITPRGSLSGPSGLAAMTAAAAAASSSGATGGSSTGNFNLHRKTIKDVTQAYTRRQSLSSLLDSVSNGQLPTMMTMSATEGSSLKAGVAHDESLVTRSGSLSGESSSSRLLDPFKTNNNSTATLNLFGDQNAAQRMNISQVWSDGNITQEIMAEKRKSDSYSGSDSGGGVGSAAGSFIDGRYGPYGQDDVGAGRSEVYASQSGTPTLISAHVASGSHTDVSSDISYQPPSQPTSPIAQYDQPRLRGRKTFAAIESEGSSSAEAGRTVRDGAAVFEGVAVSRTNKARSPSPAGLNDADTACGRYRSGSTGRRLDTLGSPLSLQQQHQYQGGYRRQNWTSTDVDDQQEPSRYYARRSIDETETVIVSLPSPRGCLLEAEDEFDARAGGRGGGGGGAGEDSLATTDMPYLEFGLHPHQRGGRQQQFPAAPHSGENSSINAPHPYPEVVRRAPKQNPEGRTAVKSTYLDDYREQQQQQKKSLWTAAVSDDESPDSSGAGRGLSKAGRRLSTKIQGTLRRLSLTAENDKGGL
ncbi:hypothetical protein BGZ98_004342 [Dissophora globulifera]|nr:hypothetical protein BGZ98_004342 [Dissophora globulifera]